MRRPSPRNVSECQTRVRYNETDQMGFVHHSIYFVWFEMGRTELCRQAGIPYADLEREHELFLPLVEASCRLQRPLFYDDLIRVRTWMAQCSSRLVRFDYEVVRAEDGSVVATGGTTHIPVDRERRRAHFPSAVLDRLLAFHQSSEGAL